MCTAGREPLRGRHYGRLAGDHKAHRMDVRRFQFLRRLGSVTAIGKQDTTALRDHQSGGTPRKAAKIVNIRKVGNQQGVKLVVRERGLESVQAARVIHSRSVARRRYEPRSASLWPQARSSAQKAKPLDSRQVFRDIQRLGLFYLRACI